MRLETKLYSDGILQVTAKDKMTGKEQKIKVAAKSGLTMEDVQDQVKEAEVHESEDKIRLEAIQIRNEANQLVLRAQQFLAQGKISNQQVQSSIDALKKTLKGNDTAIIKAKIQELQEHLLALYTELAASKS